MLEQAAELFDNRRQMMKRLKKKTYETNMEAFREEYGALFAEMTAYTEAAEDKEEAAKTVADAFTGAVKEKFTNPKNGKVKGYVQVDLNLFMIYYVFPALLLTGHEDASLLADAICASWNNTFADCHIQYTDYESLLGGFRNKIFGIF